MSAPLAAGGKSGWFARIFGIGWTLFSAVFVVFGLGVLWGSASLGRWQEIPCTIQKFEIAQSAKEGSFRPDLSFTYEYAGQAYTGTRLWKDRESSEDYEDLSEIREPLFIGPEGLRSSLEGVVTTCHVNPDQPTEAVLVISRTMQIIGGLAATAVGSLFVLIGLVITFGGSLPEPRSPHGKASGPVATVFAIGFFGLFAAAGSGILLGVVVPKARDWFAMHHWQETTAEIISSRVGSHRGNKGGTTYSVDLFYRYDFKGREYRSGRYTLMGGSSSGYDGKAAVVKSLPPGSKLQVFVDPEKPWRAVVKRGAGWWVLFVLFPLTFMAFGFGGIWGVFRKIPPSRSGAKPLAACDPAIFPASGGSTGFGRAALTSGKWERTRIKPAGQVLVFLIIAALGIGSIGLFIRQDVRLYREGSLFLAIFFSVFLIPFVGIGLVLIGGAVQHFVMLFGPVYEIRMDEAGLRPGESTCLRWRRTGGRGTVTELKLLLVGREEALMDSGTKRSRALKSVFHEEALFETSIALATAQGQVELKVPADAVPSFAAASHCVRWRICLLAKVAGMPEIRDDRDFRVLSPKSFS